MKNRCWLIVCGGLLLPGAATKAARQVDLRFKPETAHHLTVRNVGNGAFELETKGNDPHIELQPLDTIPANYRMLAFEYFAPTGLDGFEVYYGPPMHGKRVIEAGSPPRTESWLPFSVDLKSRSDGKWTARLNRLRLDFGRKPGVLFRIRKLQLRAAHARELRAQSEREAERRNKLARESLVNAFYSARFPDRIDQVRINRETLTLAGERTSAGKSARLIEIQPEVSVAARTKLERGVFMLADQKGIRDAGALPNSGRFTMRLPRRAGTVDRATSRWAVGKRLPGGQWKLLSHWKYATDLAEAAVNELPRQQARSIKGMGGVSARFDLNDLVELGVHNITINFLLTNAMDTEPHRGWTRFEHAGRAWFVNLGQLQRHDKVIRFAADNDMVVSAILLVNFSNSAFGKMLVHPEADRAGHYAMPNFTSAEGVAAYEAVLEFLARRYSGTPHGRIVNWIVHNEVGFGWEWTNMGSQPAMLYLDHYLRSMRLVHNVTRRHDPQARVFMSLTHHWNHPGDTLWKSYCNRDLINRLAESSRIEGDFAWGVAYHPYPQNLRRPDAWNDQRATDSFDTPFITPRNIAVLDRWMRRPEMRDANGKVRGVLLSEQGFHAPGNTADNQRLQAAALVYMWRQMKGLRSIEAFHYHRWVDHPREGGLLFGLREHSAGPGFGPKKQSWEIYQSLGTSTEEEMTGFALDVIGNSRE